MTGDDQDGDQHDRRHGPGGGGGCAPGGRSGRGAAGRGGGALRRCTDRRRNRRCTRIRVVRDRQRPKPGEFVADELSLLLRDQPYQVRCLLARTRRLADRPAHRLGGVSTRRGGCRADPGHRSGRTTGHRSRHPGRHRRPSRSMPRTPEPRNNSRSGCCDWWCSWNRSPSNNGTAAPWPNAASPWCKAPTASAMSPAKSPLRRRRHRRHARRHGPQPRRRRSTHRPATPLRPVRRPAPRPARLRRHRPRRRATTTE